ncbi:MAG TPA: hypothetical protein PKH03_09585 [Syntrophales bacterium]|nr:hypothetical protein [Syntrophales bacterium]
MKNTQDSGRWRNAVGMLGLGALCLVLAGCAVFGRDKNFHPYDPAALTQIVPGKSTAEDVTRLFGPPTQVVKLTGGNAYVYSRSLSKGTGLWLVFVTLVNYDTQYDQVVFFLNPQNVVTHCGSALRSGDAAYGLPF